MIILLSAVFPVLYNVTDGVRSLSSQYVDVARSYGASERQITWEVIFPGILPFIGAGVKQSLGRGLTGLIVAEFFIGASGLGGLLQETTNFYRFDKSFVIIFTLVLLGYLLTKLSETLEENLGKWKKSERAFN
jgi:ABC-type nitrate/sulfonate/bicarbonate transport system permease component